MEGVQTRRRNAQNRFWIVVIVLSIVAIVYLLYKPSSQRSTQGGGTNKVVGQQKQTIIEKVQAVFQDPTDYGDFDYTTTDMFIDNWQDRMGRPHYLAWDEDYSTTPVTDYVDEENDEEGREAEQVIEHEGDQVEKENREKVQEIEAVDKIVETVKTSPAAEEKQVQLPGPSSSTSNLLNKLKDLKTKFEGVSSDMTLLKTTDPLQISSIEFITSYRNPCFNDNASNFRCFPAFFIAGMPRCETKLLHTILDKHPSITAPDAHSPSFWTGSDQIPVEKYLDHFKQPALTIKSQVTKESTKDTYKALTFDSNPSLFWKGAITSGESFKTPLHLKHILPNSKIVIMVRDPIDRLYSEYMRFETKGTPESFDTFARTSLTNLQKCEVEVKKLFSCIHRDLSDDSKPHLETGIYYLFYQEWIKSFTSAQILVIRMEDFNAQMKETVKKVLNFLQVEDTSEGILDTMLKDATPSQEALPPMKASTKKFLYEFYQPYNSQFAKLLKNDALSYTQDKI